MTVFAVPVQNRIARCGVEREGFAELLGDPGRAWMVGDREMQNPPSFMVQYYKDPVGSKNSCGFAVVEFEEPSEALTASDLTS